LRCLRYTEPHRQWLLQASSILLNNLCQHANFIRIPIGVQFLWAIILALGLFVLPESPRYFVKKGRLEEAAKALADVRGQPIESEFIQDELAEIIANHEYELSVVPQVGYISQWTNCFTGT